MDPEAGQTRGGGTGWWAGAAQGRSVQGATVQLPHSQQGPRTQEGETASFPQSPPGQDEWGTALPLQLLRGLDEPGFVLWGQR